MSWLNGTYLLVTTGLLLATLDAVSGINVRGWLDISKVSEAQVSLYGRRRRPSYANEDQTAENCDCTSFTYTLSSKKKNVWVFGDSISQKLIGYYEYVENLMGDQVELHYGGGGVDPASSGGCGSSFGAVACLPNWIGNGTKFDAITFNWGLHDIAPDMYTLVEPNEYESNLMSMHSILADHLTNKGKMIWQTTTPVPPGAAHRANDDVIKINDMAKEKLSNYDDVLFNDLYSQMIIACHTNASEVGYPINCSCHLQQSTDVHMTDTGSAFLAKSVAMSIYSALGIPLELLGSR